jgi:hypothetical protein
VVREAAHECNGSAHCANRGCKRRENAIALSAGFDLGSAVLGKAPGYDNVVLVKRGQHLLRCFFM